MIETGFEVLFGLLVQPLYGIPFCSPLNLAFMALITTIVVATVWHGVSMSRFWAGLERTVTRSDEAEQAFKSTLRRLAAELDGKPASRGLAHALREFDEATHLEQHGEHILVNAHQAADFIHLSTLVPFPFRHRLAVAAPQNLTGIGILGTFTGLVMGLFLAQASATDEAPMAIVPLINSLSVAFVSSVLALAASLALAVFTRWVEGRLHRVHGRIVAHLDASVVRRTSQQLLESLLVEQQETRATLQGLSSDIALAFEQAVEKSLAPRFQEMHEQNEQLMGVTRQLAEGGAQQQVDGMNRMVENFIEKMNDALGSHLTEASAHLVEFSKEQALVNSELRAAMRDLQSTVEKTHELTQSQEEIARQLRALLDEGVDATEGFAESARLLERAAPQLRLVAETSQATVESTRQLTRAMEHRVSDWETQAQELRALNEDMSTGIAEFASQFPKQLRANLEVFDKELATATRRLAEGYGSLREVTESLQEVVEATLQASQEE